MTPLEVLRRAHAAGLNLERTPRGTLRVRGPKVARIALRPAFMAFTDDILRLLAAPAPAVDQRRCSDCGRGGFTIMVVRASCDHLCRRCSSETTRLPNVRQSGTPAIDRLTANADARAERGDHGGAA